MALSIRPYRLSDLEDLALHANSTAVATRLRDSFPNPYTLEHARYWIKSCLEDNLPDVWRWGICLDDRIIGGIGAMRDQDIHRFNAEIGYWLNEAYWQQGYATQALQQATEWLFFTTDLRRLYAGVMSSNQASMRVLEKVGYCLESIRKESAFKNGSFWDEHYFVKFRPV